MLTNTMKLLLLLLACLLPTAAYSDGDVSWGQKAKTYRTPVDGMKTYYEPGALKKDGGVVSFKMYTSYDPASPEPGIEYKINCDTQEYSHMTENGWQPAERMLPGEQIFPIAKKLCDWGPNFFQRHNPFD